MSSTLRCLSLAALLVAGGAAWSLSRFAGTTLSAADAGANDETNQPAETAKSADALPAPIACRWCAGDIVLDGRGDEPDWRAAEAIDDFRPHWLDRKALTATRAKLLWNDGLYFFAEMDDADLYADVLEPDGMAWLNDVFELFLKPSDEGLGYYEFQVNAANTPLDMYLPSRGAGGYGRFIREREFHLRSAVVLRGTLGD